MKTCCLKKILGLDYKMLKSLIMAILLISGCIGFGYPDRYSYKDCPEQFLQPPILPGELLLKRYLFSKSQAAIDSFFYEWSIESQTWNVDTDTYNSDQLNAYHLSNDLISQFISEDNYRYPYYVYNGVIEIEIVDTLRHLFKDTIPEITLDESSMNFSLAKLPRSIRPLYLDTIHYRLFQRFFCSNSNDESWEKRKLFDSIIYVFPSFYRSNFWILLSPPRNLSVSFDVSRTRARVSYGSWPEAGGWKTLRKGNEVWIEEEHIIWVQ